VDAGGKKVPAVGLNTVRRVLPRLPLVMPQARSTIPLFRSVDVCPDRAAVMLGLATEEPVAGLYRSAVQDRPSPDYPLRMRTIPLFSRVAVRERSAQAVRVASGT